MSCVGIYGCDELIVVSSRCRWCAAGLGSTSWRVYCCFYSRLCSGTSEISCFLLWLSLRQCSCLLMSTAILKIRDALRQLRHFFSQSKYKEYEYLHFSNHTVPLISESIRLLAVLKHNLEPEFQRNKPVSIMFRLGQSCVCKCCSMAGVQ